MFWPVILDAWVYTFIDISSFSAHCGKGKPLNEPLLL